MRLIRCLYDGQPTVIAYNNDGALSVMGHDMLSLVQSGLSGVLNELSAATFVKSKTALNPQRILAPIPNPGKVIAIGLNYMDHIREQKKTPPTSPLMFSKFSSSVINPDDEIRWSPAMTAQVDYEGELAVVIGKVARRVSRADALDYVFGYTCANDVTARDLQNGDGQWTRAKGLETFCPLGPCIVTADEVPDPQALWVRTTLNGQIMQNGNTRDMIFDVATLIAHISQAVTLYPGDVILTGTPDGVGNARTPQVFLKAGDEVIVEIEKIGALRNVCVEEAL